MRPFYITATAIAAIAMGACSPRVITRTVQTRDSVWCERMVTDTVIRIAADTALMRSFIECDSLGNVLIAQLEQQQGERTTIDTQYRYVWVKDKDGGIRRSAYFDVLATADSLSREVRILREKLVKAQSQTKSRDSERSGGTLWAALIAFAIGTAAGATIAARR